MNKKAPSMMVGKGLRIFLKWTRLGGQKSGIRLQANSPVTWQHSLVKNGQFPVP